MKVELPRTPEVQALAEQLALVLDGAGTEEGLQALMVVFLSGINTRWPSDLAGDFVSMAFGEAVMVLFHVGWEHEGDVDIDIAAVEAVKGTH